VDNSLARSVWNTITTTEAMLDLMREQARNLVPRVARLVRDRNEIDAKIAAITGRPVVSGHLGEWIASQLFDIDLEVSAVAKAIDGRFTTGRLAGRTVNVKWYAKREGLLDMTEDPSLDYYLVLTGPESRAATSRGLTRPLSIAAVYLFDAPALLALQLARGAKVGIASSIPISAWKAAEIYPEATNTVLDVHPDAWQLLDQFSTDS